MRHETARWPWSGINVALILGFLVTIAVEATGAASPPALSDPMPQVRIGMFRDGPWQLLDELKQGIQRELDILVEGEFEVVYGDVLDGRWQIPTIDAQFRRLLADDDVDLVIALGLAASQLACLVEEGFDKPVIAPLSLDFEIQNLPRDGAGSGVRNLTYVGLPSTLRGELQAFKELVPYRHVALLANTEVLDSMPEIRPRTLAQLAGLDIQATYIAAGRTAKSVLERLPEDVDAVYTWPLLLDDGEMSRLIDGLNERRLPTFSSMGRDDVAAGMLATMTSDAGRARLVRRVALNIQQILLGIPPETIAVDFRGPQGLIINQDTARRIGVSPRFDVLLEAELLGTADADPVARLPISEAVDRAVTANLDWHIERLAVESGLEDVRRAKSALRPTLSASASGVQIDKDRAGSAAAERTWSAGLTASQLLYSDGARGAVQIESALQRSREASFETLRLDIALDASIAYLNLLRAETQFQVFRSNLDLTRSNLDLARSRRAIGTANASETFRWENQIANDRRNLVDADSTVRSARVVLNRILHVPLETRFELVEVAVDDPTFSPGRGILDGYIETPLHFGTFREFVVTEGLENSTELKTLDASIAAQQRALTTARRAFWAPQVSLSASLDERLETSGVGADIVNPNLPDDTDWSVSLGASLPLFSGGSRKADRRQAELELRRLELQREATAERVEEAIRTAMISARGSFTGINLAQDAATAARKNFELVQDAYGRGAIPIIDLIDAQNSTLAAELDATDAVYNFFIDLMQVQRSANRFDFFTGKQALEEWVRRLQNYFDERGIRPWGAQP